MADYDGSFIETRALLAALAGDSDTVRALVGQLNAGEQAALIAACDVVTGAMPDRCEGCRQEMTPDEPRALSARLWHPGCFDAAWGAGHG